MNTTTWTRRQHKGITTWEGVISRGPKGYRIIASARDNYVARSNDARGRWWLDVRSQYVIIDPLTNEIVHTGWFSGSIDDLITRAEINVQVYEGDMANNEIRQMEYEADEEAFRLAEYAENTI